MLKRGIKKIFLESVRDFTSLGNPVILALISLVLLGFSFVFWQLIFGLILVEVFCTIIKIFFHRGRPRKEEYSNLLEKISAGSFPSLHTARSAFVFLVLSFLSSDVVIKTIFIVLMILIGASRVILKKHYVSDVFAGLVIGALASLLWRILI
ncbi:MAG: phosphatase PAP2 family protein [Nanoarchaeota archaeon]|nr:phosphatase PAP2 family protein [Nanoarchaeota archaeon]MBU4086185.1 phosphatase PAP2 family protein [Nanoarchaeota archaeon]